MSKLTTLFAALVCAIGFAQTALSADALNNGILFFQKHQYQLAEKSLLAAAAANPTSASAHYYLANTLVKLNKHTLAQQHYRLTMLLEPKGTYAKFASDALRGYEGHDATVNTASSDRVPAFAQQYNARSIVNTSPAVFSQKRSMLYQHGIWQTDDGSGPIDLTLPAHTNNSHFAQHSSLPGKHANAAVSNHH